MKDRRNRERPEAKGDRRHPLRGKTRLRPKGPAIERRLSPRVDRERLTVKLPRTTTELLRNAVYWTPGVTITSFIEQCIIATVARLEKERGGEFPEREEALRAGRPTKRKE